MKVKGTCMSQSAEGCVAHVMGQLLQILGNFRKSLSLPYALKQAVYKSTIISPIYLMTYGMYLNLYYWGEISLLEKIIIN